MSRKTSADTIVKLGAGGAALLLGLYAIGSYTLTEPPVPGCMAQFERTAVFDLSSTDGAPLSGIELQARAGAGEVGIMENTKVVAVTEGPSPYAIEVALAPADGQASGFDFVWRPIEAGAKSACLRYSVWLPEKFEYGPGGNLPGLFGTEAGSETADAAAAPLRMRTRWQREGMTEVVAKAPATQSNVRAFPSREKLFKRGQWNSFEQELVVNAPGADDGRLKLWINGKQVIDERRLAVSKERQIAIAGVLASVGFAGSAKAQPNADTARLQLSPIEIGWR